MSLTTFKALSFDCYGTLIDWETGIYDAFRPILDKLPSGHRYLTDKATILKDFDALTNQLEVNQPHLLYTDILAACYGTLAQAEHIETTEQERTAFGHSVGKWPAFSDTVAGLQKLKKYYKLSILSNVDNENIRATLAGPLGGVHFDAVYTAEDIKTYKPNHRNFMYLLDHLKSEFGLEKSDLLHTAHSLTADHVPAKELGLTSVWITRDEDGKSAMGGNPDDFGCRVGFSWKFPSIGAMAQVVEREFEQKE